MAERRAPLAEESAESASTSSTVAKVPSIEEETAGPKGLNGSIWIATYLAVANRTDKQRQKQQKQREPQQTTLTPACLRFLMLVVASASASDSDSASDDRSMIDLPYAHGTDEEEWLAQSRREVFRSI